MINADYEKKGRSLVTTGQLVMFRQRLGFTRSAMAEMLHTSPATYKSWEVGRDGPNMWTATAERLGRFYTSATEALEVLEKDGLRLADLTPFHVAATYHGLPQELLLKWYRDGLVHAVDLGILGLWMHRDDMHQLREVA